MVLVAGRPSLKRRADARFPQQLARVGAQAVEVFVRAAGVHAAVRDVNGAGRAAELLLPDRFARLELQRGHAAVFERAVQAVAVDRRTLADRARLALPHDGAVRPAERDEAGSRRGDDPSSFREKRRGRHQVRLDPVVAPIGRSQRVDRCARHDEQVGTVEAERLRRREVVATPLLGAVAQRARDDLTCFEGEIDLPRVAHRLGGGRAGDVDRPTGRHRQNVTVGVRLERVRGDGECDQQRDRGGGSGDEPTRYSGLRGPHDL